MKKANGIKILSALLVAMTTLCGCSGATNDSSSSSSATMSSEKSSSNDTSASSSATTSSEESSSMDDSSSSDPYLEALNITYTLDEENHTYTVTGVKDKQAEEIDLPRELTIDNVIYVLVRIGDSAFSNCSSLTSITIPSSVTSIGELAFENCTQLQSVTFEPNSKLESIGGYAFKDCSSLIMISIPSSVTIIGESAFEGCNSLESLTLPFIDTYISYYFGASMYSSNAHYVPESLKTIIILGGTSIPVNAFSDCSFLKSVTIPSDIISIERYAFYNCSALESIIIPSSVTSMGEWAFYACVSLTIYCEALEEPEGWKQQSNDWNSHGRPVYWGINENTFIEKDGVQYVIRNEEASVTRYVGTSTNLEIPTTIEINENTYDVINIEKWAFDRSSSLISITIPSSVTYIGDYAFYGCSALSITIPNSVTVIRERAFYDCSSSAIYCEASEKPSGWASNWNYYGGIVYWGINENNFIEKDGIQYVIVNEKAVVTRYVGTSTNVEIPTTIEINEIAYDVTSIGEEAFEKCSSLTSIVISNSVTSIALYAFVRCTSLESIVIPDSVTSIGSSAFSVCDSLTIYCEASSKPSDWNDHWNSNDRPVYWGEEWHYDENGVPTLN